MVLPDRGKLWICLSGLEADADGNLYVYGTMSNSADILGTEKKDFSGAFLLKMDTQKNISWIRYIEGGSGFTYNIGNCLELSQSQGLLYLAGEISDTVYLGGLACYPENGNRYVAKYDLEGNYSGYLQLNLNSGQMDLASDNSGNLIVSGDFRDTVRIGDETFIPQEYTDLLVMKFNPGLVPVWARQFGGEVMEYSAISSCDESGNIYVVAEILPSLVDFSGTFLDTKPETEGDVILAKLSPAGDLLWIRSHGRGSMFGRQTTWPTNIISDKDGYTYIMGWHGDSVYFGDNLLTRPVYEHKTSNMYGYFVGKFDPDGNTEWVKSINMGQSDFNYNELDLDEEGNFYVMARFQDTLNFIDQVEISSPSTNFGLFIAKYTSEGDLDWIKTSAITNPNSKLEGIAVLGPDRLYAGGSMIDGLSLDDEIRYTSNNNIFLGLLEHTDIPEVIWPDEQDEQGLLIFPNPFSDRTTVRFSNPQGMEFKASVMDMTGKSVLTLDNIRNEQFDLYKADLSDGIYLIELRGDRVYRGRFLIVSQ